MESSNLIAKDKPDTRPPAFNQFASARDQQSFHISPIDRRRNRIGKNGVENSPLLAVHAII